MNDPVLIRRIILIGIIPLILFCIYLGVGLGLADRLPIYVTTHWNYNGLPDGTTEAKILFWAVFTVWLILWVVPLVELQIRSHYCRRLYTPAPFLFFCGLCIMIELGICMANLDVHGWQSADDFNAWIMTGFAIVPPGLFISGYAMESDYSPFYLHDDRAHPVQHFAHSKKEQKPLARERNNVEKAYIIYTSKIMNKWLLGIEIGSWCTAVLVIFAVGYSELGVDSIFLTTMSTLLGCYGAFMVVFSASMVVEVHNTAGLLIKIGPLGLVRRKICFRDMTKASIARVSYGDYHGWGVQHRTMRTVYLYHSGDAVRIQFREAGGREILFTLNDCEEVCNIVNEQIKGERAFLKSRRNSASSSMYTQKSIFLNGKSTLRGKSRSRGGI